MNDRKETMPQLPEFWSWVRQMYQDLDENACLNRVEHLVKSDVIVPELTMMEGQVYHRSDYPELCGAIDEQARSEHDSKIDHKHTRDFARDAFKRMSDCKLSTEKAIEKLRKAADGINEKWTSGDETQYSSARDHLLSEWEYVEKLRKAAADIAEKPTQDQIRVNPLDTISFKYRGVLKEDIGVARKGMTCCFKTVEERDAYCEPHETIISVKLPPIPERVEFDMSFVKPQLATGVKVRVAETVEEVKKCLYNSAFYNSEFGKIGTIDKISNINNGREYWIVDVFNPDTGWSIWTINADYLEIVDD